MVIECKTDEEFRQQMAVARARPVLVCFTTMRNEKMEATVKSFVSFRQKLTFLNVDVNKCAETVVKNGVSATPIFILYIKQKKMEQFKEANIETLKAIDKLIEEVVPGQLDLSEFMDIPQIECINGCNDMPVQDFFEKFDVALRSDCNKQIIFTIPFTKPVNLHTIFIKGAGGKTPKRIRVFTNLPKQYPVSENDPLGVEPIQILDLGETAKEGELVRLKNVKFQNVNNVQLFFENNQEGGEATEVTELTFYGIPANIIDTILLIRDVEVEDNCKFILLEIKRGNALKCVIRGYNAFNEWNELQETIKCFTPTGVKAKCLGGGKFVQESMNKIKLLFHQKSSRAVRELSLETIKSSFLNCDVELLEDNF